MALCIPDEEPILIEEYFNGEISDKIEGENGFGYDLFSMCQSYIKLQQCSH